MNSNYLPLGAAPGRIPWFRGIVLGDVWIGGSGKITLEVWTRVRAEAKINRTTKFSTSAAPTARL
jgi:hypothetical protein